MPKEATGADRRRHTQCWTMGGTTYGIHQAPPAVPRRQPQGHAISNVAQWTTAARSEPRKLKRAITTAMKKGMAWCCDDVRTTKWRAQIAEVCSNTNIPPPPRPRHDDNPKADNFVCYPCGALLASRTAPPIASTSWMGRYTSSTRALYVKCA
eukprot:8502199-Pyramimonas_sp.AAC.1